MTTMRIQTTVKRPNRGDFRTIQEYHAAKLRFFESFDGKTIISVTYEETVMA
jgi:hypothetical protein